MSESWTKYFQAEVDKFVKETGFYPEYIIMPESDLNQLEKDRNIESVFSDEFYPVDKFFYKNIILKSDKEINNWIIVAPDNN